MKNKVLTLTLAAVLTVGIFAGCASKPTQEELPPTTEVVAVESGKVAAFYDGIVAAYGEDFIPGMDLDEATFAERFSITMDNVKDFKAAIPMISTHVDTLIVVEAEEGKTADVEAELNAYRDTVVADAVQYPMNIAKVNASKVYTVDEYVFFVMLGAIDETSQDEAAQIEFATAEVEKAIVAIDTVAAQ